MTDEIGAPLDWVKQVDTALLELEEKPQFGFPALLNWDQFEQRLRDLFDRPSLQVSHAVKGWVEPSKLWEGAQKHLLPLTVDWAPLDTPIYFVTTENDLKQLMGDLLGGEERASFFLQPSLTHSFYHYFAAEMLHVVENLGVANPLSPRLGEAPSDVRQEIKEPCFVVDLSLNLNKKTFWGRLLFPKSFRGAWKSYFSHLPPPSLTEEARRKIRVDLGLEVGHTRLGFEDWKKVRTGDFILLDHCSYDPEEGKGGVQLTLNQSPVMRGRFKEGGIKLTGYPVYEEVSANMDDEELLESEEEEEDLYGDLEEDEEEPFAEEEERIATEMVSAEEEQLSITPEELPIHLTVEVGRLRMSAQELMELAPGNLLELSATPEQGVDLIVNGRKVGRGELIRMGETLGVRILSL